ncbi:MAG: hypothetical protein GY754_13025 [bacterium]|nr:hypothetical protein [bacterium]
MKRSYRIVIFALLSLILFGMGCKSDSDILATFKGGDISRGEFYEWLKERRIKKEMVIDNRAKQKRNLKNLALEKLTILEAKKAGYEKSEDYKQLRSLMRRHFEKRFYIKKTRESIAFKEEVVKARIIKLTAKDYRMETVGKKKKRVPLSPQEVEQEFKKRDEEARSIIEELNKGTDFAELATKKSHDYSKKKGGDIGYIAQGMRGEEFSKAVLALKAGEFSKEPVVIRNSLFIIKADEKLEVSNENIKDVITDEKQAERLEKRLRITKARAQEKKLTTAKDIETSFDGVSSKDVATVLFKVGKKSFTVGNLNEIIAYINKLQKNPNSKPLDDNKKKSLAGRIFQEEVFSRETIRSGMDKGEEFKKEWEFFRDINMARNYKNEVILADVTVTEEELKLEYDRNKKRMELQAKKVKGRKPPKIRPYAEEKSRIEGMLKNRKRAMKKRRWEKELLGKSDFKINEDKLEGKDSPKKKTAPRPKMKK